MAVPRKFAQFEVGPAVDVPWASAIEAVVAAGVTVVANDIVIVNGVSSGLVQVTQADADAALTARGLLYVAVTGGTAGSRVQMVPWRFLRNVNTAGSAIGNPLFLSGAAGGWSLTVGTVVVQVGEVLAVSATAGAVKLSPNSSYGSASQAAATESLTFTINDDAVAGSDEDPALLLLGGDGGAEIIRTALRRDSSADWLYIATSLSTVGATGSDRTTGVTIGPNGNANAAGNDIDSVLQFRYHVPADAVGTWRTATLSADAGLNVLQVNGSHAAFGIDVDAGTGGVTIDTTDGGAISIDAIGAPSNISLAATLAADDLTISVTGAFDASLFLTSTGTGADAVRMQASVGGIDIDGVGVACDSTGALSLSGALSSVWQVTGTAAGGLTLTLDCINAGAGAGTLILAADDTVQIGDAGNPAITHPGSGAITHTGNPTINLGTGALTLGGASVTTTAAMVWTLLDNNAAALDIGSAGATALLRFTTTDGAEAVACNGDLTTTDGVAAGLARRVEGSILRTVVESAAVTGAEAIPVGGSISIPANSHVVGTRVGLTALVRVSAVSATPTLQVRFRVGGVAGVLAFDTGARTVADEDLVKLEGYLDCRTAGAAGNFTGALEYKLGAADALSGAAASEWALDVAGSTPGTWTTAAVDLTVAQVFAITLQTDGVGTDANLESFRVWLGA